MQIVTEAKRFFVDQSFRVLGLPNPNLPFETRWRIAEHLSKRQQSEFIRTEVIRMLSSVESKSYNTFWGPELDPQEISESNLPEPMKNFLGAPFNDPKFQNRWGNPIMRLAADTNRRVSPHFDISISMKPQEKVQPLGIFTFGSNGGFSVYAGPAKDVWIKNSKGITTRKTIASPELNPYAKELQAYIDEVGDFSIVRDLARFAGGIIGTLNQSPTQPQR